MVRALLALALSAAAVAWAQHDHGSSKPGLAVSVVFDEAGRLWRAEARAGHVWLSRSEDKGRSFHPPVAVNAVPENIAADGENRPKVMVSGEQVFVSWTQSLPKPYTGHVRFARSLDGGRTFTEPITVNDDQEVISHRFDVLVRDGAGDLHLIWLDKRDAEAARRKGEPYTGAALYHAVSRDGGAHFGPNERLVSSTCECCRLAVALDPDGVPVVMWRHVFPGNVRDHALLRLDGRSQPVRVTHDEWAVEACPHHGPDLAIAPDGSRHLVWFSGGGLRQGLFYRRMDRDGSLSEPLPLGVAQRQAAGPAVAVVGNTVVVAWKALDAGDSAVFVRVSGDGGRQFGGERRLASTAGASDRPLLVDDGRRVFLSWNTALEGHRLIPVQDGAP